MRRQTSLLAAELIRSDREWGEELSSAINGRIASILIEEADFAEDKAEWVDSLFASSPTIVEAKLYTNARWFLSTASENPYFSTNVAKRITMMLRTITRSDFEELSAYGTRPKFSQFHRVLAGHRFDRITSLCEGSHAPRSSEPFRAFRCFPSKQ